MQVILCASCGERNQIAPMGGVVGSLQLALGRACNPMQLDAIELKASTEIDVDPLLVEARTLPRTRKVIRSAKFDPHFAAIELNLAESPADSWRSIRISRWIGKSKFYAVAAAVLHLHQRNRWCQQDAAAGQVRRKVFRIQTGCARSCSNLRPLLAVVGYGYTERQIRR